MASAVAIRAATSADLAEMSRLGAMLVDLHHELDPDRFIGVTAGTERAYRNFLRSELQRPEVIVLVAEEGDRVLGYAYAGLEGNDYMALRGPAGVIYDLMVEPSRRHHGIGRLLLDATVAGLVARGAPRVMLSSAQRNRSAQRLFARAGFKPTMIEMIWAPHVREGQR